MAKHKQKIRLRISSASLTGIISLVFFIGVACTLVAAIGSRWVLQRESAVRVEHTRDGLMATLNKDISTLESALKSQRAFFIGSEEVHRDEFYNYISASGVADAFSGLVSYAYVPRVIGQDLDRFFDEVRLDTTVSDEGYPEAALRPVRLDSEYWPIVFAYPEYELRHLIGFDYRSDPLRRATMEQARDSGLIAVSAPTVLAGAQKRGALMLVPLYMSATVPTTVEQRRDLFRGALLVAIRFDDFLANVAPSTRYGQEFAVVVEDVGPTKQRQRGVVLAERKATATIPDWVRGLFAPVSADAITIVGGRQWQVTVHGLPGYALTKAERLLPWLVLAVGILLSVCASLLINDWSRRRSLRQARVENIRLRERYAFLQTLSSKLQSSVTAVFWAAKKLQKPQAKKQFLQDVASKSKYIQKTMDRLSYFFLLDAPEQQQSAESFSVSALVKKAAREFVTDAGEKHIEMIIAGEANDRVHAPVDAVTVALSILIENAIEYNKPRGRVIVKVVPEHDQVLVRVIDSGIGIPKADQKRVFQPFFRASNAVQAKEDGSGTSLYLAKQLIESAGGDLTFESREDSGSVFILRIPRGMS